MSDIKGYCIQNGEPTPDNPVKIETLELEKDIKRLKHYLKNSAYKEKDSNFFKNGGWEIIDLEIPQSLEHLLSDYTRQKQINKEHQKINGELREKVKVLENSIKKTSESSSNNEKLIEKFDSGETFTFNQVGFIEKNFISKQKIKDKKEELEDLAKRIAGTYQYADSEDDLIEKKNKVIELKIKAEALQKLLQESEDK